MENPIIFNNPFICSELELNIARTLLARAGISILGFTSDHVSLPLFMIAREGRKQFFMQPQQTYKSYALDQEPYAVHYKIGQSHLDPVSFEYENCTLFVTPHTPVLAMDDPHGGIPYRFMLGIPADDLMHIH